MKKLFKLLSVFVLLVSLLPVFPSYAVDYNVMEILGDDDCITVENGDSRYTMDVAAKRADAGYSVYTHYKDKAARIKLSPEFYTGGMYNIQFYNYVETTGQYGWDIVFEAWSIDNSETPLLTKIISQRTDVGKEGWLNIGDIEIPVGKKVYFTIKSRITDQYTSNKYIYYCSTKFTLIKENNEPYKTEIPAEISGTQSFSVEMPKKTVQIPNPENSELKIYVENGKNGDGTLQNPFGTIEAARDYIRSKKNSGADLSGGVTVYIRGGEYYLPEGIEFSMEDSGTKDSPIIYSSYNDEEVNLSVSRFVSSVEWENIDTNSAVYERIPLNVRDKVRAISFDKLGIKKEPQPEFGIARIDIITAGYTNARYPNDGTVLTGTRVDNSGEDGYVLAGKGATFTYIPHSLVWDNEFLRANGRYKGVLSAEYVTNDLRLSYVDKNNLTLSTANIHRQSVSSAGDPKSPHYVYNIIEEMDLDGEYVIDYVTHNIYFIPPAGSEYINICTTDKRIITIDSKNLVLNNINAGFCTREIVKISNLSEDIQIIGGEFSNSLVSESAITIAGKDCILRDADIFNINGGAIKLSSHHDTELGKDIWHEVFDGKGETHNTVENCIIHDVNTGIMINYSNNNIVKNNYLYNVKQTGINIIGMNNIVELNRLENICYDSDDVGAMYAYCHEIAFGNIYRYNLIKNVFGRERGLANGIYLDDYTSGFEVYGNILINISAQPLTNNSGDDNKWNNNIIYSSQEAGKGFGGVYYSGNTVRAQEGNGSVSQKLECIKRVVDNNGEELTKKVVPALWEEYEDLLLGGERPSFKDMQINNNIIFNCSDIDKSNEEVYTSDNAQKYGMEFKNNAYLMPEETNWDINTLEGLDFDYIRNYVPEFEDIPVGEIGIYNGGQRKETAFESFKQNTPQASVSLPENGGKNISDSVTLKWSNVISKGAKGYEVYIAEDENMTKNVRRFVTSESEIELTNLDFGRTYYWYVVSKGKLGNPNTINNGGIQSFSTMSLDAMLESAFMKLQAYLMNVEEETGEYTYPEGTKKELIELIDEIEVLVASCETDDDKVEAYNTINSEIEKLIAKRKSGQATSIYYYDDFETNQLDWPSSSIGAKIRGANGEAYTQSVVTTSPDDSTNSVIRLKDKEEREFSAIKEIYPQKTVTVSTKIRVDEGNMWMGFLRSFPKWMQLVGKSEVIAPVHFNNGKIYTGLNREYEIMEYEAGQWYTVKIEADMEKKSYSVYIDGNLLADGVAMPESVQYGGITEIGRFGIFTTDLENVSGTLSNKCDCYADNIIIFTPGTKGITNYAESIKVNKTTVADFDLEKYEYNLNMSYDELVNSSTEVKTYGDYSKSYILDGKYARYIMVFSGNGDLREYRLIPNSLNE